MYDFFISSFILLGLFAISFFKFDWTFLLPVLFVVGGIYIIFREYFFAEDTNGEEKSQEIQDDVDDSRPKS
jgi:Na+/H+ antiporter NhaD/arsenite permease-like protein